MKKITLFLIACLPMLNANAQQKKLFAETETQKKQRMQWWENDRFGMFIHWGLYSLAARHEWVKFREHRTNEEYQKYFDEFDPDHFEPKKWAEAAKAAGMKYAVLTTKHHEGFCLFESRYTDYKATKTAAKRDLVKEYVEAFRAEGIKVGLYYSLLDWHYPDYTVDAIHPLHPATSAPDSIWQRLNKGKDFAKYRQYLYNQITELMSNYGKIDVLWLDFSFPGHEGHGRGKDDWGSVALVKQIRKLQPGIIINNRLDLDEYKDGGDFETPEQVTAAALEKFRGKTWETCQTFSGSWGYNRDENTWKTNRQLLNLLITSVANGGNLILNVGPTARGEFDCRANTALDSLALWMHANDKSIYNCTYAPAEYKVPDSARLTYNATTKKLYVHLYNYPTTGKYILPGYGGKIKYVQFLNDYSEIITVDKKAVEQTMDGADIVLSIPIKKPNFEIPVIELSLR